MGEQQYRLTDEGVQDAIEILERGGYLPEASDDEALNTFALKAACAKYIAVSVAKGDARSDQECQDALVIGFLDAKLQDTVRRLIN
jgi:hypothetical protein